MTTLRSAESYFQKKVHPDSRASATKEKGGSPEDSRQKVNTMEAVAELKPVAKAPRIIPSLESPDAKAGKWLDQLIEKSKTVGVITQIVEINPALARGLLNRNPNNRNISERVVDGYATDMANGAWKFNGEPIIVSSDGFLNDGQHRCEAIIRADVSIDMLLVIGIERATRTTLDQGRTRTTADYLAMDGYTNTTQLSSVASYAWQFEHKNRIGVGSKERPTKSEVMNFVEKHPNLITSLNIVARKGVQAVGGIGVVGAVHWAISKKAGKHHADDFFIALIEGANLPVGNAILYVRNRLINESRRLKASEKAELLIKAWNSHRANQTVRSYGISGGELPKISR